MVDRLQVLAFTDHQCDVKLRCMYEAIDWQLWIILLTLF
jgi:hypothetical protein